MNKGRVLCISLEIHGFAALCVGGSPCSEWDISAPTCGRQSDQKKPLVLDNLNQYVFVKDMK